MSFILSFGLQVLIVCLLITLVQRWKNGPEAEAKWSEYFNVDKDKSVPFKYAMYSSMTYVGLMLASIVIFPLAPLASLANLVTLALAWWWLVETVMIGKPKQWVEDATQYFNKK